jgi:hypothetical protein
VLSLSRLLLTAAGVAAVLVLTAPTLRAQVGELRDRLPSLDRAASDGQSEAQISAAEFAQIRAGLSPRALRNLVGEPAAEESTELEGLRLECMSYGIVGSSGIYQFCFANGKLASKLRYAKPLVARR